MANRLSGINPLAYVGVNAKNPSQIYKSSRQPASTDVANFEIGTMWIYNDGAGTTEVYMLTDVSAHVATWLQLG